jgi:dihydroxy-acid dehydratase
MFDGTRPVIGICNTWSELTPCNGHFRDLAERVRRGVLEAGGVPLEFPVTSLGETLMRPTAMMFRNLCSMDVEESIRANPMDGVVLLVGCDKTTPALIMGAASCNLPTIVVSGGPMLNGVFRGERIGSGTYMFHLLNQVRTGEITEDDVLAAEGCMARSIGHCMTMGTASTMAAMVEALGLGLPGNAAIPAADARRSALAQVAGRRAVDMVRENLSMDRILTREAFENAIRVCGAIGGSTNAVIHLIAIAGRVGVPLTLDDWATLGRDIPCLLNLMPSGQYLMEDFYYAGGLQVIMKELGEQLHTDVLTANGRTLGENIEDAECWDSKVIRPLSEPHSPQGGIAVLRGNFAPAGAVLKPSAASPHLLRHRGRAVVFEDIQDYRSRIDDPDLDVDEACVLVLRNCGAKGYPGLPEVGNISLPRKLLEKGVTDMVRISDARMSGTAFGTVILHVSPESAAGGPIRLLRSGDVIEVDVSRGLLHAEVSEEEFAARARVSPPPPHHADRGYAKLYVDHVLQPHQGSDFDFLVGSSGAGTGSTQGLQAFWPMRKLKPEERGED